MTEPGTTKHRIAAVMSGLALVGIVALDAIAMVGAQHVGIDPASSLQGSTHLSLGIFIFGAALINIVFAFFLFLLVDDVLQHRKPVQLLPPMVAVKGVLVLYLDIIAAQSIDFERHNLAPGYAPLYDPAFRLWQSAVLILWFGAFAWLLVVVLKGRGYRLRRVALLFIVAAIVAVAAISALIYGGR
jgi:hypothetical protein